MDTTGHGLGQIHRRVLVVLGAAYAVTFLVYFGISLFTFPAKYVLNAFRPAWTFGNAFIGFMNAFLPVHCSAILVSYSFAPPSADPGASAVEPFSRLIMGTLVVFLVLTFVFALLHELALPATHRSINEMEYNSAVADVFLERAETAVEDGDVDAAEAYVEYYLTVDPRSSRALALRRSIFDRKGSVADEESSRDPTPVRSQRASDRSPAELVQFAEEAMETGDYFTAYYYAGLAYRLAEATGVLREDARRLSARAWEAISEVRPSREETAQAELFEAKKIGLSLLAAQTAKSAIDAYYLFKSLSDAHPQDAEVRRYLAESLDAVARISFFVEDAEAAVTMPGAHGILFVNSAHDTETEIAYIGKVVQTETGVFLQQFEVLGIGPSGDLLYHIQAPLAQILEDTVLLRGISRTDPGRFSEPVVVHGPDSAEAAHLHQLGPERTILEFLRPDDSSLDEGGLLTLLQMAEVRERYGYTGDPPRVEAMARMSLPFSFLILSLLSVSAGWRLRVDRRSPPIIGLLLIPGFPFVVNQIVATYQYVIRVLVGGAVLLGGMTVAVTVGLLLQSVILFAAIAYLAGTPVAAKAGEPNEG